MLGGDVEVSTVTDQCRIHRGHIIFNQAPHVSYPFLTDKQNLSFPEGSEKFHIRVLPPKYFTLSFAISIILFLSLLKKFAPFDPKC